MIVYWQSDQFGPISPDRALALRTIAELTSQSASSQDLKVEVQALKLLLQNVRAEIGDSRRFYSHFSDAISQCFWVLNIDSGQTLVVSDNFERVWGASRKILADGLTGFMSTVFPADRDRVLSDFHLNLGIAMETELRVIAADGEVRWIRLRAFPDTNEVLSPQSTNNAISQNGRRIVLIADDITTKRAEDETVRNREAELISRARMIAVGDLAAGVAHEINNPLTIIVGKAMDIKRLVRDPKPDAKLIQELVEKIQKTSLRIADIVSSLKSLSRKEKNLSCQTTSFTKVFTELRDLCTERLKARGVRFQIETKTEQLTAEINSTQISQALLYLIDNGLDAIENDKEKWITIDSTEDKDSIFIYVTDSGPGIPVKNRGRIFDPFFTTKEPGKGTGLGLSLASSIVTRHGGSLSLDTMNSRTRFVLQLPKKQQRRPT
jgi:C4-dicarboxylate-specific signal transduction histidine kinase